jgi:hypothetical protein
MENRNFPEGFMVKSQKRPTREVAVLEEINMPPKFYMSC